MIFLVGDHDPAVTAHVAIPRALALARAATGVAVEWQWIGTDAVGDASRSLAGAAGVWVVPASPYASMEGALAAIRYAREGNIPFLGTCGGFQHAVIEFARHVAGMADADHAETAGATGTGIAATAANRNANGAATPARDAGTAANGVAASPRMQEPAAAARLVVTPLSCSLVEKSGEVHFVPGSRLHGIFGGQSTTEGYHCRFGVNPVFRARLEAAGLRFTGFDAGGDIRAFELPSHDFFIGTLFQPERSALRGNRHPLIDAFVRAASTA